MKTYPEIRLKVGRNLKGAQTSHPSKHPCSNPLKGISLLVSGLNPLHTGDLTASPKRVNPCQLVNVQAVKNKTEQNKTNSTLYLMLLKS